MIPTPSELGYAIGDECDLLLVNPPFGGIDRPSFALHLLQAIALEEGVVAKVLYGNLMLARHIGEAEYEKICYGASGPLLGERFFSKTAYGHVSVAPDAGVISTHIRSASAPKADDWTGSLASLALLSAEKWCDEVAALITDAGCKAVGMTTTFEQTAAALSLARAIRKRNAHIEIILGGANCEGEMALGLATIASTVDRIFSGESEETFRQWCRDFRSGANGSVSEGSHPEVVQGNPCLDLDALPLPDYSDYYRQLSLTLPESKLLRNGSIWLPFETSRGCWWGQKHHCTFCGINGDGMGFREKSTPAVIKQLRSLSREHPTDKVMMLDNIMPHSYFSSVLPQLAKLEPKLHIFYEQKANLDFRRVASLSNAGIRIIQPGIEALDSDLLRHMRKGVRAKQNIALLRYALMHGVFVNWNLLHSFPGDRIEWYENTLSTLPYLTHLCPPTGVFGLSIDRFSPYFDRPDEFGIEQIAPIPSYFDVLPASADVARIAYHFEASYRSDSRESVETIDALESHVGGWRDLWSAAGETPTCSVIKVERDMYILIDSRPISTMKFEFIDHEKAVLALFGLAGGVDSTRINQDSIKWAVDRKFCLEIDATLVPVATCSPALYLELDSSTEAKVRAFQDRELRNPEQSHGETLIKLAETE